MRVLHVSNVHDALPRAIKLLFEIGIERDSRNGKVLFGGPVTTVYGRPLERVIFWRERDANPFFHLYESLWMLAGRNDVAPLERYVKRSTDYSDDGKILHGAYGFRWRKWFGDPHDGAIDQLPIIAETLRANPDDRRCVLAMWDADVDLGRQGRDLPCNTIATFQRGINGELNLTVFCRSNDIVWGAYGANAVQFGTLLEYMALWIGCPVGTYEQISVNWHGYLSTLDQVKGIRPDRMGFVPNPYTTHDVLMVPMSLDGGIHALDNLIETILYDVDSGFAEHSKEHEPDPFQTPWTSMVYTVLRAHHVYKMAKDSPKRFTDALEVLGAYPNQKADWIVAATQWVQRRLNKAIMAGELTHP